MYKSIPTTENEIWSECIRMWHDVAVDPKYIVIECVYERKYQWMTDNGYNEYEIKNCCFFCQTSAEVFKYNASNCSLCPGKEVNPDFFCADTEYCYEDKPIKFYKELLRLNKIRLMN